MAFDTIIDKYRREATSKRDMGTKFEELMCRYFKTDPTYESQIEWVCLWSDFPYRKQFSAGQDVGIDLVAKTKYGDYWAIQCKCYEPEHNITKEDVDTFLTTSAKFFLDDEGKKTKFACRLFVSTTNNWSVNAITAIQNQEPQVSVISLTHLQDSIVDWDKLENGVHGKSACKEKYDLRDHQKDAYTKAMAHYKEYDRGRCIMACGTGKTFTSLRITEGMLKKLSEPGKKSLVLFLAPSIALVGQTLREWSSQAMEEFNPICVCSDATVSKKKVTDDDGEDRIESIGLPATTDVDAIVRRYKLAKETTVIFSTYQSIDCIIDAQKQGLPEIDMVICDEAHRTTGQIIEKKDETIFTKVHDNGLIRAKKRMYMTATPRIYGIKGKEKAAEKSIALCSMDDEEIYGKEFYYISFGTAVEKELLSDYKVLILTTTEDNIPENIRARWKGQKEIDVETECKIWGCLNALAKHVEGDKTVEETDPQPMKNAISFTRSISTSKDLTKMFNTLSDLPNSPRHAHMNHIDGSMYASERDRLITWLKNVDDGGYDCNILSNVRCLSEGVDVPALDAVMFMSSKGSLVDIVQSVGRVMRRAPGKKYGYIIIPIVVPKEVDAVEAMDDNEIYKPVWNVLRALRSHDERIESEINTFMMQKPSSRGKGGNHIVIGTTAGTDPGNIPMVNQYKLDDFTSILYAKLVDKVGDREYIENWAKKVATIVPELTDKLDKICHNEDGNRGYKLEFNRYLKGLRACVNDNVTEEQAINMLVQQIVTKPIFTKLFAEDGFEMRNSVSGYIDGMLEKIDAKNGLKSMQDKLDDFYHSVETTLNRIDTTEGKQKVITALYEKFFKVAFAKDQAINGIVYTPQEIVDFIINSACEVIKEEFGLDINDECVKVLDPFTGTGTFIARLMESGLIKKENLERKFRNELFANEITLLAYYIATVNIENTLQRMTGATEYVPYDNILLTDTFNIEDICRKHGVASQSTFGEEEYFVKNKGRIRKEHDTQFTIIMGNPPYGANQKSANDNAKKRSYEGGIHIS